MENLERAQSPFEDSLKNTETVSEEHELLQDLFTEAQIEVLKERTKKLVERVLEDDCRLVIFLDRSARPISWMFRAAWERYAGGKPLSKIKFANIGSEKTKLKSKTNAHRPIRYLFHTKKEYEEKTREYWSEFEPDKYIANLKKDVEGLFKEIYDAERDRTGSGKILIVDDTIESGETADLARDFFEYVFPDVPIEVARFLTRDDAKMFRKEDFRGAYLPWNTDKSLTLLKDEEMNPKRITAEAERDEKTRARGVQLKKELEGLFEDDVEADGGMAA